MKDPPDLKAPVTGVSQTEASALEQTTSDTFSGENAVEETAALGKAVRMAKPVTLAIGSVLGGRYQIEATLGQGGSGTVVRAWDRVLGEPIAIKILHPERAAEESWIKRLAREVKVARAIRHPNVCRVFDFGQADGHWFVTMELATGGSLRQRLSQPETAQRPLATKLEDARALCAGLAAIHAVGIIHRDVTPQNVLCMAEGRLVLSDFGLAIGASDNTTIHGGTPNYMAPETLMGDRADQRSDVWQLGVILHEILFGRRPDWERSAEAVKMKWPLASEAPPVEEELARLCGECLAQNPVARPATAMAVVGRLAAAEAARPRTAFERRWLRAKNLARRYRRVAVAAAAMMAVLGVARGVQVAVRPPLCRAVDQKVEGIWDMEAKATARRAFAHTGKGYAQDTFWSVNRALEGYLAAWKKMYTEACEATHVRGEQSAEVLDLRMACLNDRLSGVRALTEVFSHADGEVMDSAVDAANALGALDRCADVPLLKSMLPPPRDERARAEVDRLRRELADAKALHDAGKEEPAAEKAKAVVAAARRLSYGPVIAEGLEILGQIDVVWGDNEAAETALKEAFWQAEASRHDEVKASAATFLVVTAGRRNRYEESADWARLADATLTRIGGHERMRGWLETHVALVQRAQGRNEEAIAHDRRAAELKERSGAGRGDVARNLANIAISLSELGRPGEALPYLVKSCSDLGRALGEEHPYVAVNTSNQGEILNRLGRYEEARALFKRALLIEERSYGPESTNLAYPLAGLADGYLHEHRPAEAIAPLERALRIREAHESDLTLVADTQFALARALWESGGDRERAGRLAVRAREVLAGQPAARDHLAEVDRWLSVHRRT